jgi:hypothetical protein
MRSSEYIYYQVGDFKTSNKLQAIEHAGGNMNKIFLYFADDVHAQYDWTKEPKGSINDLIDRRVRELRARHRYVCLWYSGGYDSQTILESFLRTGSRIDEVLVFGRPWLKTPYSFNIEQHDTVHYINTVKNLHQPWMKITMVDYDPDCTFNFYKKHGADWIYHDAGHFPWFSKTSRANTQKYQKEFMNLNEVFGRVDIEGPDKPHVDLRDGKWYVQVPDKALTFHMDIDHELFYLSPEATEIYIKQAWLVIKWFESLPDCSHEFVHKVQSNHAQWYAAWNRGFGRADAINRFEATGQFKQFFGSGIETPESTELSTYASKAHENAFKNWRTGLTYLSNKHSGIWSKEQGFPAILSKPIYVKDYTPRYLENLQ